MKLFGARSLDIVAMFFVEFLKNRSLLCPGTLQVLLAVVSRC
jgi:hypothetical protein